MKIPLKPLRFLICALSAASIMLSACTPPTPLPTPAPSATATPQPSATYTSSPVPTDTPEPSATPTLPMSTSDPANPIVFQDSLPAWTAGKNPDYTDSSALSTSPSSQFAAAGEQSLELDFDYTQGFRALFALEQPLDLTQSTTLQISIADPDGVLDSAAISLSTGEDWTWYETAALPVKAGQNDLSFELQGSAFKSAASGWNLGVNASDLDQVQRLVLILFPHQAGKIYLTAVTAITPGSFAQPGCPSAAQIAAGKDLIIALTAGAAPQQYIPLEFDLAVPVEVQNPFDPAQIDVFVTFSGPGGLSLQVPAFWYQGYDPTGRTPCGDPGWKARFTPSVPGKWNARAAVAGKSLASQAVQFDVAASQSKGFVRIQKSNPHFFAFDDGETFYPVGINIGWWQTDALEDYRAWFDSLQANGGSIARVWMADWSFGIEWKDTPLGDYTRRMRQAWLLDQVFRMAEERGIYIELVLINHGIFSENVNPEWADNPYNTANGGPLQNPEDFASDPAAQQLFQRRLRYIAARWASSPNLFAWEWWNEANWTPITDPAMAAWIKAMTPTLRKYDPYHHLISTSYADLGHAAVLGLPEIDFTQAHLYDNQDTLLSIPSLYQDALASAPNKPLLFAEFGFSASIEDLTSYDKDGTHLHNGLWTSTFKGFSGPAMYWWWDSYVAPLKLWNLYASLTQFLAGEDMALYKPAAARISGGAAQGLALLGKDRAMLWVKNNQFIAAALPGVLKDPLQGVTLTLQGLPDGNYMARWYDPTNGKWLDEASVQVKDKTLTLDVPSFTRDLAVKIEPVK